MYKQQQPQKSKMLPLSYCSLRHCKDKTKQQLNCMFMIKDLIKNTTCTFFTFCLSWFPFKQYDDDDDDDREEEKNGY